MVEWGQGERGRFRVEWEEKHKWLLNRMLIKREFFILVEEEQHASILRMP